MKIIINHKNLKPSKEWQEFRKVRAIIEDKNGNIAIGRESGKVIFPGGKCDKDEDNLSAIIRELSEETGITFLPDELNEVLTLETMYDDAVDYRTNTVRPRHTITTYYYVKTNQKINTDKMNLTEYEIQEDFNISFMDKDTLVKMLNEKNETAMNWHLFYDENQTILNYILPLIQR